MKKLKIQENSDVDNVKNSDILNIAWLYFQQHAQQRISFFNFFVAFSTLTMTGLISTFQSNQNSHIIGIFLGVTQMFITGIFWKIDERNKHLTKHGEDTIKEIERACYRKDSFCLFVNEPIKSYNRKINDRNKHPLLWCARVLSHGKAFIHIFCFFGIAGLLGTIFSIYLLFNSPNSKSDNKPNNIEVIINIDKIVNISE